jgi:hypothetical protein
MHFRAKLDHCSRKVRMGEINWVSFSLDHESTTCNHLMGTTAHREKLIIFCPSFKSPWQIVLGNHGGDERFALRNRKRYFLDKTCKVILIFSFYAFTSISLPCCCGRPTYFHPFGWPTFSHPFGWPTSSHPFEWQVDWYLRTTTEGRVIIN